MSVAEAAVEPAPRLVQAAIKARRLEASLPPAAWIALIPELLAFERHRAALASRYNWCAFLLFLMGVVSCGAGKATGHGILVGLAWLLAGGAVLLLVFRGRLTGGSKLPAADLTGCLKPLVALLAHDMDAQRPLALRFDLHDALEGAVPLGPFAELPKPYRNPRHLKVEERSLRLDRFSGTARLRDGGELRWQVVDQIRERRIRKKGRSGKIKSATKYKAKRQLEVRLSVRADRMRVQDADPTLPEGVRIRTGARRSVVRARASRIVAGPPPPLEIGEILDLMTAAFRPTLGRAQKGATHGRV